MWTDFKHTTLNDLSKILLRFRVNQVAITTDIEKAFLHVGFNEADRDATRFLWLSEPSDPTSRLQTYIFKSVLFGATWSPFILSATLLKHLKLNESQTAKLMERDLYVDNVISSVRDENEATHCFYEARLIMATAGFSCIVLHWLKSATSLKRFVTNRVNEIRKSTSEAEWRYCPTEHNPADLVTRGITESNFTESVLWRKGPEWLVDRHKWPNQVTTTEAVMSTVADESTEINADNRGRSTDSSDSCITNVLNVSRYTTYIRLVRVTASIQRFIFNCRHCNEERQTGALKTTEIDYAVRTWIQQCQESSYKIEISMMNNVRKKPSKIAPRIKQLGLFLDR